VTILFIYTQLIVMQNLQ